MATKTEDGREFEAGDYCYVPDASAPSTWKLRITDTPGGAPDPGIVGAAAAALGPGFRGNKVDIPDADRPAAVACVRRAWMKAHPDMDPADMPEGIRLSAEPEIELSITSSLDGLVVDAGLGPVKTLDLPDEHILTVDSEKRVIGLRVVPYNVVADHPAYGRMLFLPGAFGKVNPGAVRLRMDHEDPPTGLGIGYSDRADGAFMDFRVSRTQRGDEQLTLAKDGVSRGTSPGFMDVPGGPQQKLVDGKVTTVYGPGSAVLAELSTTWSPTFSGDGVMYVLSNEQKGSGPMAEPTEAPVAGAVDPTPGIIDAVKREMSSRDGKLDVVLGKFEQFMDAQRAAFKVPSADPVRPKLHHWVEMSLRTMRGQPIPPTVLKELALDDVVTTDNPGLVPDVLTPDYDDVINADRPFLQSTRKVEPPATGTSMILPIITTRAVAGTQAGGLEKGDLTTTATKVGTGTFAYQSVFGGADISIQMINRAERSFFDLLTGDMGMAYALDADAKAVTALLTGYTDSDGNAHAPDAGGVLDPEDLSLGGAWATSITVYKRAPDTIWLSALAVAAFIDAKSPINNGPLYSNLAAAFTAAGGAAGALSGLRPVYVPALDDANVDIIVGPSRGFVWAEDPARNLQVDVPSKAGRDIALVGGIFPAPRYADAFTTYTLS